MNVLCNAAKGQIIAYSQLANNVFVIIKLFCISAGNIK